MQEVHRTKLLLLLHVAGTRARDFLPGFLARRRPPPAIRAEVDLGFRIEGQSVFLLETRPHWRDPGQILEHRLAKGTFNRSRSCGVVYWMRSDLKWHRYAPCPEVASIEEFVALVERDDHACFFG